MFGCDLLSFYYLCRTGNNHRQPGRRRGAVVICFHFTIFVVLETTNDDTTHVWRALWFAFILLSLSYWKQLCLELVLNCFGCDLLSFYYLCRTGNNSPRGGICNIKLWFAFILLSLSYWKQLYIWKCQHWKVVICFHFTIFVVLETTQYPPSGTDRRLWFAFILLSLSYWKQRRLSY